MSNVLIIVNSLSLRTRLKNKFKMAGWNVSKAENIEEALDQIDRESFEVVALSLTRLPTDSSGVCHEHKKAAPDSSLCAIAKLRRHEIIRRFIHEGTEEENVFEPYNEKMIERFDRFNE